MSGLSSRHVLVVDDEPELCPVIRKALRSYDYHITCAKNGYDALRLYDQERDSFSLILTDINMPGMSGCELALDLKARGSRIPILLMSDDCIQPLPIKCRSLGLSGCLAKPFTPDKLRHALDETSRMANRVCESTAKALNLRVYPDPILREYCTPISTYDSDLQALSEQMFIFMRENCGVGLAGPQVGIIERIIVADDSETALCLVNPEIISASGTERMVEGCLSLPGVQVDVARNAHVGVIGKRQDGKRISIEADGLLARILQHEIDHLNGTLICDYDPVSKMYL
ncbi:MAG: peptide deformylase [Victivallales bacterium]|nr:peptide deformylase [Victivallales bacterium]